MNLEFVLRKLIREEIISIFEENKGLWANIHAKRKRGEKPAKPGDDDYPDKKAWDAAKKSSKKESLEEAEYEGRQVTLNKPMKGDTKKYKVYVKNDKGNVVKVEFGDPNMDIKRDNPERKKSFRARHKCDQKKDKTTAGYWSCKMWSNKPVSDILKGK